LEQNSKISKKKKKKSREKQEWRNLIKKWKRTPNQERNTRKQQNPTIQAKLTQTVYIEKGLNTKRESSAQLIHNIFFYLSAEFTAPKRMGSV